MKSLDQMATNHAMSKDCHTLTISDLLLMEIKSTKDPLFIHTLVRSIEFESRKVAEIAYKAGFNKCKELALEVVEPKLHGHKKLGVSKAAVMALSMCSKEIQKLGAEK